MIIHYLFFKNIRLEYLNRTIKFFYKVEENKQLLKHIYHIEEQILENYNTDKEKVYTIHKLLNGGMLKSSYDNNNHKFILKISGIWENHVACGITYKVIIK